LKRVRELEWQLMGVNCTFYFEYDTLLKLHPPTQIKTTKIGV
jgi:hypothetical protein